MAPPQYIGPYELVRPLGMGGMAETYVALRRGPAGFEQRVCIKRVLPVYAAEPRFVEMFLDEARLLAHLRNANITQVYDFGQAGGSYYIAMELVEGRDLEALLRGLVRQGQAFPVAALCYVLAQLLSALSYAHTLTVGGEPLSLVHRDISPSNVLVSSHGEVKLTDFGIAKSSRRAHRTKTGHTRGKLAYMSPEQLRGEEIDGRSDLFAVGVLAYELLSGRHPFDTETDLGLIQNIVSGTRTPLAELVPGCPPRLLSLIDDLLQSDRELRPASADQALSILPYEQAPHVAQRAVAELVKRDVLTQASVAASPAWSDRSPDSSGETAVRTPHELPPVPPLGRTDAVRNPAPSTARARTRLVLALGTGLVLSCVAVFALLRNTAVTPKEEPSSPRVEAPITTTAVPGAAPNHSPPEAVTDEASTALGEPSAPAGPAGALPARDTETHESDAGVDLTPTLATPRRGPARASSEGARRRATQATPAAPAAPVPAEPAESAGASGKRGRSGLSVRPDDF